MPGGRPVGSLDNHGQGTSEKRKRASRKNGGAVGAGNPGYAEDIKAAIKRAREKGASALPALVDIMLGIMGDPGAEHRDKVAAFRELASRCGMPVRTESEVAVSDLPVTLVDLSWFAAPGPEPERQPAQDSEQDGGK